MSTLKLRAGALSGLPALAAREPAFTTDRFRFYVGSAGGNRLLGVLENVSATADPTVNDDSGDGYSRGTRWANTTNGKVFICANDTVGAAVWKEVGAGVVSDGAKGDITVSGSGSTWTITGGALLRSNNLSDLTNVTTARTNLGLGTAALKNTGSSGDAVPLLNQINTFSDRLQVSQSDATANGVTWGVLLEHNTSGTPAAGLGTGIVFTAQSSTSLGQLVGGIKSFWSTATHASRKGRTQLVTYDVATERVGVEVGVNGTAPTIGFLGTAPVAQAAASDVAAGLFAFGLFDVNGKYDAAKVTGYTNLTAATTYDSTADELPFYRGTTNANRKITLANHLASISTLTTSVFAYLAANQTLTCNSSTVNVITLDTEVTDNLNEYNPATYTFTPANTGVYVVSFFTIISGTGANRNIVSVYTTGGTEVARLSDSSGDVGGGNTQLIPLTGGTSYNFRVFPVWTGAGSALGGSFQTSLTIKRYY